MVLRKVRQLNKIRELEGLSGSRSANPSFNEAQGRLRTSWLLVLELLVVQPDLDPDWSPSPVLFPHLFCQICRKLLVSNPAEILSVLSPCSALGGRHCSHHRAC